MGSDENFFNFLQDLGRGLGIVWVTVMIICALIISTLICWPLLPIFNGVIRGVAKQRKLGALRAGMVICKLIQIVLGLAGTFSFLAVCAVNYAGGLLEQVDVAFIVSLNKTISDIIKLGQDFIWYGWLVAIAVPVALQYLSFFFGEITKYNKLEYILNANHRQNSLQRDLVCAKRGAGKFVDLPKADLETAQLAIQKALDKFDGRIDIKRRAAKYKKSVTRIGFWAILPPVLYGIWRGTYGIFYKIKAMSCRKNGSLVSNIGGDVVYSFDGRAYQNIRGKIIGYCRDSIVYSKDFVPVSFIAVGSNGKTEEFAFPQTIGKVDLSEYAV